MESKDILILREKFPEYLEKVTKNYKRNFILLIVDSAFFGFSLTLLSTDTVIPYFISQISSNKVWIGLISALYILGYTLPQLIGSYLVDIFHLRKKIIFLVAILERFGILLIAIFSGLVGNVSSINILILFSLSFSIFSFTNGLIGPAYNDFVSKNINQNRGIFYGVSNIVSGIIGFFGSLTVKSLLDSFEFPNNIQIIFWLSFITSFISPFIIANFREVKFPVEKEKQKFGKFLKESFRSTLSNVNFKKFMLFRGIIGLSEMGFAFYSIFLITRFDLPVSYFGYYSMIVLITMSVFGIFLGMIGDRFGYKSIYVFRTIILCILGFSILFIDSSWVFFLAASLVGIIYSAKSISDINMLFEIAPPIETSKYLGVDNTILSPFYALAPIIGGFIIDITTYDTFFKILIVLSIFSVVFVLFFFEDPRSMKILDE